MSDYDVYVHPAGADAIRSSPELVANAQARLENLLGDNPPRGEDLYKRRTGTCHVCGKSCKLTYEHIPPRSAYNDSPARVAEFSLFLGQKLGFFPQRGWTPQQRGIGLYSTCASCNGFSGREYVKFYSEFAHVVGSDLMDLARGYYETGAMPPRGVRFSFKGAKLGRIVRQALYMLVAASGSRTLGDRYPVLQSIIEGGSAKLPQGMRLLLTVTVSQSARITPLHAKIDYRTGKSWAAIEVAYFPFIWLLEIGDFADTQMVDMSEFTLSSPDREVDFTIEFPIGFLISAIPGDYRSREEIVAAEGLSDT